jgi:hypothetical protein
MKSQQRTRRATRPAALRLLCASLLVLPQIARSITLLVCDNNDAGAGSLRQAFDDNNALGGGNTIVISNTVTGTITLTSGELLIARDVNIAGPGAGILAITGGNVSRAFAVSNTATAYIDLTIANCTQTPARQNPGAGMANYATLFLNRCWIANNINPAIINATLGDGSDIGAVEVSPLVVTTTNDAGAGSLRQTILDTSVVEHSITFASNIVGNVKLTSGELSVGRDLNIIGPGAGILAISGNNSSRAFYILSGWNVFISKLTIRDGRVTGSTGLPGQNGQEARGGGIMNEGTLSLTSCVVSNNTLTGGTGGDDPNFAGNGGNALGGGIGNIGTLTLTDCHIVSNSAAGGQGGVAPSGSDGMGGQAYGGALYTGGTATLIRSTISGNTANGGAGNGGVGSGSGGGLYNDSLLTLLTCTVAGNAAVGSLFDFGGGIFDNGTTLTLRNSTIAGNQADYGGGLNTSGSADLGSTILAGNSAPGSGPDCSGNINSSDYNLIQNTSGATFTGTTAHNIIGLNPILGPLAGNGGLPPTMALSYNSPAIDKGKSFGSTADQRGAPRPFDFASVANASGGDGADIGAFELGSPALGIQPLGGSAIVSWPAYYGDFALQSITNLTSTNWTTAPGMPVVVGNQFNVTNGPTTERSFYRLKQQ